MVVSSDSDIVLPTSSPFFRKHPTTSFLTIKGVPHLYQILRDTSKSYTPFCILGISWVYPCYSIFLAWPCTQISCALFFPQLKHFNFPFSWITVNSPANNFRILHSNKHWYNWLECLLHLLPKDEFILNIFLQSSLANEKTKTSGFLPPFGQLPTIC